MRVRMNVCDGRATLGTGTREGVISTDSAPSHAHVTVQDDTTQGTSIATTSVQPLAAVSADTTLQDNMMNNNRTSIATHHLWRRCRRLWTLERLLSSHSH